MPRQETVWKGEFGSRYTVRNTRSLDECDAHYVSVYGLSRTELIGEMFREIGQDARILEVGCNIGCNLGLLARSGYRDLWGIELQAGAASEARRLLPEAEIIRGSALHLPFEDNSYDLVFTCGVLIHIVPSDIHRALDEMYRCSRRYLHGLEYYLPDGYEMKTYRGQIDLMWKTDYCRLFKDRFPNLMLVEEKILPHREDESLLDQLYLLAKI